MTTSRRTFFRHVATAGALLAAGHVLARNAPKPAAGADKDDPVIYTCSMHPEVKQAKPGTCPICGMTLVKAQR